MDLVQLRSIGDEDLFEFLNNAPKYFREGERIKKFQLKNGDFIHCVLWNYHFYITGTDIVKILVWRFQNSGRQLGNMKKFEEGIFSDLRNLKPGIDASLEGPRSEFLEFLYKNGCIRTQKKQKVFYWYSVPHDALFCDALERDMRRDSSLYNYSGYQQDRMQQQFAEPAFTPKFANFTSPIASQLFANNTFKKPEKNTTISDVFNIKSALFGNIPAPEKNIFTHQKPADLSFDKIFSMDVEPSSYPIPQIEDYEDESKMKQIKSKIESDLKKKFDDFDLDQLGFLKDRCQDSFSFITKGCDKKPSQEINSHDKDNINLGGKVSFIGKETEHIEH